jgi:RNA polymerase sigma-70 factor, ECF subfamily
VGEERDKRWSSEMAAAQSGDAAAYERLLRDILPFLRLVARRGRVPPDLVEDIVQDTLLTIHRVRHTYDPGRPLVPWLAAIAKRRSIDARRRSGRIGAWEQAAPDQLDTFPDPATNRQVELDDKRDSLNRALKDLPRKQRDAIELVKLRGLSVAEAATASGQSAGAIKVNVHRAVQALRALFKER